MLADAERAGSTLIAIARHRPWLKRSTLRSRNATPMTAAPPNV